MSKVKVGVIGGGLISQVEHLPNLLAMPERFEVVGLADPSAKVRAHLSERYGIKTFATADEVLAQKPDAVVIGTPDATHADLAIAALDRGLHVFCEKPLCYSVEDADRVIAARDRAGRVMQVGYMKRFDPSWQALRKMVEGRGERLRMITVEVNDPGSWPFTDHHDFLPGDDVAKEQIDEVAKRRAEQTARAIGRPLSPLELKGFTVPFCSSSVHDVNAVHGLLDAMGLKTGEIAGSAVFADGAGAQGLIRLTPGTALWSVFHLAVPKLADYFEKITLFFDDRIFELRFPSPYLNHQPTELDEKRSDGLHLETVLHRPSYREAFVEELRSWHASIAEGARAMNPVEEARTDMALLAALGRKAFAA
jgi:predicted dehydrogenase